MVPWLRMLSVVTASTWRPALAVTDESVLSFTCLPTDIDINLHMNNARYLALMDLGRADLILRCGLWRLLLKDKLQPVIGAANVRFRRSLLPFQRFRLTSRMIGWDDRRFYLEQRMERRGATVCEALVTAVFLGRQGRLAPAEVAARVGWTDPSPTLPMAVSLWQACEQAAAAAASADEMRPQAG